MKHRFVHILAALSLAFALPAAAQKTGTQSYDYMRGVEDYKAEKYADAQRHFEKAIAANPKDADSHHYLALLFNETKQYREALEACTKALALTPKKDKEGQASHYDLRAQINLALADSTAAIADFTTAIKLQPENENYLRNRADAYLEMGRLDEASADYEAVIRLNEGYTEAYLGLGQIAHRRGQDDEALRIFERTVRLSPLNEKAHLLAAEEYLRRGKTHEATEEIMDAIEQEATCEAAPILQQLEGEALQAMIVKMECRARKNQNVIVWPFYIAQLKDTQEGRTITNFTKDSKLPAATPAAEDANGVVTELAATKTGGMFKVEGAINDVILAIHYDANSTKATVGSTDVLFLLKNSYVKMEDFVQAPKNLDANGQIPDGTEIVLRQVKLGTLVLENLHATVSTSQKVALIVGPDALSPLGTIETDATKRVLKIIGK